MDQGVIRSFKAFYRAILQASMEEDQHVRGHDFTNFRLGMRLTNKIGKLLLESQHKF